MDDLIRRQDTIDALHGLAHRFEDPEDWCILEGEAEFVVSKLPPAQPEWIPVSERLPEPNEMVLISVNGEVDADWIAVDNTGYGCWYRTMKYAIDIDAWMPLPTPYGEREKHDT